jgi:galactose oxidase
LDSIEEELTALVDAYAGYLGLISSPTSVSYVDLNTTQLINGIAYIPGSGYIAPVRIGNYSIATSIDNSTWITQASGKFVSDPSTKYVGFPNIKARYVRLNGVTQTGTQFPWNTKPSFSVLSAPTSTVNGQWGSMIAFPLVPAAAFIRPDGKIVTFSSYRDNEFNNYPDLAITATNNTWTATYDPATGDISEFDVINTSHDMFCPGMSFTFDGKAVITGGDSSKRTSIYDYITSSWSVGPEMMVGRGYQSSATVSDGRIFTIGGSWSGGYGVGIWKNGEIYDPSLNTWTNLTGCPVQPMITQDAQGIYRADSHAWLFGWKDGWVFQYVLFSFTPLNITDSVQSRPQLSYELV